MAYEQGGEFSVFVGDLGYEVDDAMLDACFRTYYPSTKSAKVMVDPVTGRSRGFGFVRFLAEVERDRAINEMNGVYIGSKPVRVSHATARPTPGARAAALASAGGASTASTATGLSHAQVGGPPGAPGGAGAGGGEGDPTNTTLFVGGLSAAVSEAELHAAFATCGEIVYTKIPPGKGCGFVQFVQRQAAEYALEQMNGYILGGMPIRVSWGKSSRPPGPGMHTGGAAAHHPPAGGYGGAAYGHYGAPGAYADPYAGAYGVYGAAGYDAAAGYGAAGAYAAYPAGVAHGDPAYGGYAYGAAGPQGGALASPGGGAPGAAGGGGTYDPLAPVNVDKLNAMYMQRQMPVLTGHYVRVPIAMPVQHM